MLRFDHNSNPLTILVTSLIIIVIVSFLPLSELTGGFLKDYSFFSDIVEENDKTQSTQEETATLDPDIAKLIGNDAEADNDSLSDVNITDSISNGDIQFDSVYTEPVIEDYTPGKIGLLHLRNALNNRQNRPVRIAFIGDSYIEGDIFVQNVREALQDKFGGSGIGYSPLHSETSGFRRSVRQTSSGWEIKDITKKTSNMPLSGVYCNANGTAKSLFKGTDKLRHLDSWNSSTLLFISETDNDITITINDQETETKHITGSPDVQSIVINAPTNKISISVTSSDFTALGIYLNDNSGIAVDDMSIRGYAGLRHHSISEQIVEQMRNYIDYDLIVIEYGINAMSPKVFDYNYYVKALKKSISKIRVCYPNADILIMGVGDRGEKRNGKMQTMESVPYMIRAQRKMAQELGVLFWDTQLAMGGENAIVDWTENKDINKDYIHLSFKGGKRLGDIFVGRLLPAIEN